MKKKEVKDMQERLDQLENAADKAKNKLDKMSLHFVIPLVSFYFIVGLLLILLNETVTNVAAWALAAGLILSGGWLLVRYLRADIRKRLAGADMALGLVLLLAGILLIASPTDMRDVFPKIWGLSLIFGGFLKIQYAFDEWSVRVHRWWIMLIFAAVSLTIGILALLNKTIFGASQHLVVGIFMIGEAALDLVTYFLLNNGMKKQNVPQAVPATAPAAAAVPEKLPGGKKAASTAKVSKEEVSTEEVSAEEVSTAEVSPEPASTKTEEAPETAEVPETAETPETAQETTKTKE